MKWNGVTTGTSSKGCFVFQHITQHQQGTRYDINNNYNDEDLVCMAMNNKQGHQQQCYYNANMMMTIMTREQQKCNNQSAVSNSAMGECLFIAFHLLVCCDFCFVSFCLLLPMPCLLHGMMTPQASSSLRVDCCLFLLWWDQWRYFCLLLVHR